MKAIQYLRVFSGLITLGLSISTLHAQQHAPLYFGSNFERPTPANTVYVGDRVPDSNSFYDLFGTDGSTRGNWQTDMERNKGATPVNGASIGDFRINVKDKSKGLAVIATDPKNSSNRVLKYEFAGLTETEGPEWGHKSRVQSETWDNINFKEFYQQVKILIPASVYDRLKDVPNRWSEDNISWYLLNEFNSQNPESGSSNTRASRVTLGIWRDGLPGGGLYFKLSADVNNPAGTSYVNQWTYTSVAQVPRDQWFRLTTYVKEGGNSNTGSAAGEVYLEMLIDGQTAKVPLFHIKGPTRALNPNNLQTGYTSFSGMKTYTNKAVIDWVTLTNPIVSQRVPIRTYWDNYRLYVGRFPDGWRSTPAYRNEENVKASVTLSGTVSNNGRYPDGVVPPLKWVP